MDNFAVILFSLACSVGMVAMMILMRHGMMGARPADEGGRIFFLNEVTR